MSDKIAYDYMRLHAPTRAGMFVMVDHPECGDSRHRLWLKRNINGSVMGYCHNCGGRAFGAPCAVGPP